ncbi:MAG: VWA domain-containing protein [bacterium]|nr:VWA domain-containing protein [Gammaproteobacteria bacterium]HIL99265.1 VWA domain-containing protein [Pseudomonadales bacterium]
MDYEFKYKRSVSALFCCVLMITACSNQEKESEQEAGRSTVDKNDGIVDVSKISIDAVINTAGQETGQAAGHVTGVEVTDSSVNDVRLEEAIASPASYLRATPDSVNVAAAREYRQKSRLGVIAPRPSPIYYPVEPTDRDNYLKFDENVTKSVLENPVSTFSIDVDTAGYSNIRRMILREGRLPPRDSVKLEEMINYFNYDYAVPDSIQQPFSVSMEMAPAPWDKNHQLLQIGLKGFEPGLEQRPNANLVFLVDVSGSMQAPNKLGLVKKSLKLLVNRLSAEDRIAIVVYAGAAGMVLDSTTIDQKARILAALDSLQAGGSTNGGAGIQLAYSIAQQHMIKDGINRVIIASDGDMNVGTVDIDALKELVEEKRKSGIALSTLGFGTGNYNYALMEQLADVGNGNASYIDSFSEARKVLVEEMQSTLITIAKDVKIQIEFNPAVVAEYRLLGYENRLLNREDFRNDKVDAGEIGAGHTVTALYELVMVGSGAEMIPPMRYNHEDEPRAATEAEKANEVAYVRLRYKQPNEDTSVEISHPVYAGANVTDISQASDDLRFASAVAGFGQLLRGGKYTGSWGYDEVLNLARNARGQDQHGYRSELVSLVESAQALSFDETLSYKVIPFDNEAFAVENEHMLQRHVN